MSSLKYYTDIWSNNHFFFFYFTLVNEFTFGKGDVRLAWKPTNQNINDWVNKFWKNYNSL